MREFYYLVLKILSFPKRVFSKIDFSVIIKRSSIKSNVSIERGSKIYNSSVERYTYIGRDSTICDTQIGSFCSIADNFICNAGKHPLAMVSTSPVFYSKRNIFRRNFAVVEFEEYDKTVIGNDVWIGTHVFVKGGVTIGNGAVIGAYSVVTKNVEPYSIVVGNPAKEIRKRFDSATSSEINNSQWWDWPEETLANMGQYFENPDSFLEQINKQTD